MPIKSVTSHQADIKYFKEANSPLIFRFGNCIFIFQLSNAFLFHCWKNIFLCFFKKRVWFFGRGYISRGGWGKGGGVNFSKILRGVAHKGRRRGCSYCFSNYQRGFLQGLLSFT